MSQTYTTVCKIPLTRDGDQIVAPTGEHVTTALLPALITELTACPCAEQCATEAAWRLGLLD